MLIVVTPSSNKYVTLEKKRVKPKATILIEVSAKNTKVREVLILSNTSEVSSEISPSKVRMTVFNKIQNVIKRSTALLKMKCSKCFRTVRINPDQPCSQISKSLLLRLDITLLVFPSR